MQSNISNARVVFAIVKSWLKEERSRRKKRRKERGGEECPLLNLKG
jgi:hypothetical protein